MRLQKTCNCEFKNFVSMVADNTCPKCGGKTLQIKETVDDRLRQCIDELEQKGTLDGIKITEKSTVLLNLQFCLWGMT